MLSDIIESPLSQPETVLWNLLKCKEKFEILINMKDSPDDVQITEKCK